MMLGFKPFGKLSHKFIHRLVEGERVNELKTILLIHVLNSQSGCYLMRFSLYFILMVEESSTSGK